MKIIRLFHTGFRVIERPDIRIGRKNADFGQGFYLSDDEEFSKRWARERRGETTYINIYELDTKDLSIKQFERDGEWFDYVYSNRANMPDQFSGFDVITGPIANDTIYDTWGVITSGLLKKDQALRLMMIGHEYHQTAIKTDKAAAALKFIGAEALDGREIASYREIVVREEHIFQEMFAKLMEDITASHS